MRQHWGIFINNDSNKTKLLQELLKGDFPERLAFLNKQEGTLFSKIVLEKFMDAEDRHGTKTIAKETDQPLRTMSSGEQKKALLIYLLSESPDYIILDNPFDNLDITSQELLANTLKEREGKTTFIQIISRKSDLLPFISNFAYLNEEKLSFDVDLENISQLEPSEAFIGNIPSPLKAITFDQDILIDFKDVSVRFGTKTVLQNIKWNIKKGSFWQLIGKNGSGKTTMLSMITGENPKGYGQELFLFGKKKGSGETIWDIKKKIGYFTPAMTDKFNGYHTIENMLISGFNDSIGLYIKPTEAQLRLTKEWLLLLNLWKAKDTLFHNLSMGQQRLVMATRAMIKHPLLLILDELTAGLDDASAKLVVALVNKIAKESNTAIIFVSHRREPGLDPDYVYELEMTTEGSIGKVVKV